MLCRPIYGGAAEEYGRKNNLVAGANITAFSKAVDAMLDQGLVSGRTLPARDP